MTALSEVESKRFLGDLPLPAELHTTDVAAAIAFAANHPGGVVAKASGMAHKTEGGLVRLNLNPDGVAACFGELAAAGDGSVLVVEMIRAEVELIIGAVKDPTFGPVIMIGAGGITAEAAPDVVALLSPPEPGEVADALDRLRIAPLLRGWRGKAPVDIAAIEKLVATIATAIEQPDVSEIDCNPVAIVNGHPIVLDALVITT
jgi:hypothetical protein